jgi:hypothetical protein
MNNYIDNINSIEDNIKKIEDDIRINEEREILLKDLIDKVLSKVDNFKNPRSFSSNFIESISKLLSEYTKSSLERAKVRKMVLDSQYKMIDILEKIKESENNDTDDNKINIFEIMDQLKIKPSYNDSSQPDYVKRDLVKIS